jgi:hypothetical protein
MTPDMRTAGHHPGRRQPSGRATDKPRHHQFRPPAHQAKEPSPLAAPTRLKDPSSGSKAQAAP